MNVETIMRSLYHARPNDYIEPRFLGSVEFYHIKRFEPDVIVYTGATDGVYSLPVDDLKELRTFAKTIHICVAAGDRNWHPLLEQFSKEDVFSLQIGIDGNTDWPSRSCDLTMIGCVDPTPYAKRRPKDINLGATAESHPARKHVLKELGSLVTPLERNASWGWHDKYTNFLLRCRALLNLNFTEANEKPRHCNMKVLEAGLAGAILFEKAGAFTNKWFEPGWDYFEWEDAEDIKLALKDFAYVETSYAANLENTILTKYSAQRFWDTAFESLAHGT